MYLLGVNKVQICPFKGTAPGTSCCTQKGTILNPYFSVCSQVVRTRKNKLNYNVTCIRHKSCVLPWRRDAVVVKRLKLI